MIIDSHLHIGLNGWTEEKLISYLDNNGIEKAWILTWDEQKPVAPIYYEPLDIKLVQKAYHNHPDRIVPFYAPDPGRSDWKKRFSDCLNDGFAGCGELKVSYRWDDPLMEPFLEYLNEKKLPLIFHMERARNIFIPKKDKGSDWFFKRLINERFNGKSAHLMESLRKSTGFLNNYFNSRIIEFPGYLLDFMQLENVLIKYPYIRFIAHGPHIWNNFSIPDKEYLFHQSGKINGKGWLWLFLEKHDNFFCDLSGFSGYNALNRDHGLTKTFLEKLHKKVLFGTDNMELGLLNMITNLGLKPEHLENILFKNAESINSGENNVSS